MIPITKPFLPCRKKYQEYIERIYDSEWLTNNGTCVQELENKLKSFLGVRNVICVANGSLALQVSYKALELAGEVITTPYSFVATSSTLAWQNIKPTYCDIDRNTFNIDHTKIESLINSKTSAIVPVHIFGNPCKVKNIEKIAKKHNIKVIYDAAHSFNVKINDKSILNYGHISTLSFHTTKLFHTIEGGAIITNDDSLAEKIRLMINFGITGPLTIEEIGINAKMNEMEAAMGLCVLDEIDLITRKRKKIWNLYQEELKEVVDFQQWEEKSNNNYAYAPIIFENENSLTKVEEKLNKYDIFPRRYFYKRLDKIFSKNTNNSVVNSLHDRILCLPLYPSLKEEECRKIIGLIKSCM